MKKNKGFTLIELVIVLVVLAIIMLIAIPTFAGLTDRMKVRADKVSAGEIANAIAIRDAAVPEEEEIKYYPTVVRYDEIPNIDIYAAKDMRPQSMEGGYFFATAIKIGTEKKILVGIGKKEMPVTDKIYVDGEESGWIYIQNAEIGDFLKTSSGLLNETVVMPDNYVEGVTPGEESEEPGGATEEVILSVGDIVEYTPSIPNYSVTVNGVTSTFYPSNTKRWKVFSTSGGNVQLISEGSVGTLTLGGLEGYKDSVAILNNIANQYVDNNIAVKARALGSTASSVGSINEEDITFEKAVGSSPYKEYESDADKAVIAANEELRADTNVWLASRHIISGTDYTYFAVRYLPADNGDEKQILYLGRKGGAGENFGSNTFGVRPIVYLDSNVKITEKSTGVYTASK